MMNPSNQSGPVFAKTIVLGNTGSGRSTLIQNLHDCGPFSTFKGNNEDPSHQFQANKQYSINHDNSFFSAIELSSQELENSNQSAILKVWEYTEHLSKKDETMVFRGALFTIIVFNILNIDSYQAVFDKWIPLKERMSPDSFLYIVGTHLDSGQYRRIQLHDVCKACAKKDAIYLEVSNLEGFNFPLFRKLLCKRVQFMISKREELASRNFSSFLANGTNNTSGNTMISDGESSTTSANNYASSTAGNHLEGKRKGSSTTTGNKQQEISISYLEPNIMSNSVGSIMSSYFGLESWEGLATHETEMAKIAERIDNFIEKLSSSAENANIDLNNISVGEDLFGRDSQESPLKPVDFDNFDPTDNSANAKSLHELNEALKILGLNIPNHLLPQSPNQSTTQTEKSNASNTNRNNLRRMLIKLPQGQSGEMLLDLEMNLEPQIDNFLLNHGMGTETEAKKKLLQSTAKMQKEYFDSIHRGGRTNSFSKNSHSNKSE